MSPTKRGKKVKTAIRKGHVKDAKSEAKKRRRRLKALNFNVHQWIRFFSALSVIFTAVIVAALLTANWHYKEYPGRLERDTLRVVDRSSDKVALEWEPTSNTSSYKVFYKERAKTGTTLDMPVDEKADSGNPDETWEVHESNQAFTEIDNLKEDTYYSFIVRADNDKHSGIATLPRNFSTKKSQSIEIRDKITKFSCSKPFKMGEAETEIELESEDPKVAEINNETGEVVPKGEGVTKITVRAKETKDYDSASAEFELRVIEAESTKAGGSAARNIYHLDADNCEVVKEVTGANGHSIPQAFGYSGDKYYIAYGMSGDGCIVTYPVDGEGQEGKDAIKPKIAMSHPNGFTYADENKTCYSVKGWSSRAVTYNTETGEFSTMNFAYGCSGIGYDRKEKKMYTSSRTVMASYDITDDFSVANTCGVVKHSGSLATQDIGGHAGIMLRCLSPNGNKHGTNYIDIYDMKHGKYLGTFTCDLSEVESVIVNKDGFLEILANNSGDTDYIWRTNINIETLGEGLPE